MREISDIQSVAYAGVFKYADGNYGWRANVPGGQGKQTKHTGYPTPLSASQARTAYLSGETEGRPGGMFFREWASIWLEKVKGRSKSNTYSGYLTVIERDCNPVIGDIWLTDITSDDIDSVFRVMAQKEYAQATMESTRRKLATCLNEAVERVPPLIPRTPIPKKYKLPKGKPARPWRMWSFSDLDKFARYVRRNVKDEALWTLWCTSALRRGEVAGLKWSKIDLDRAVALIDWQRFVDPLTGKVGEDEVKTPASEAEIPLTPAAVQALRSWKAEQAAHRLRLGDKWKGGDYAFTSARHQPYMPSSLNKRLNKLTKLAGVPATNPHALRHTWATRSLAAGADLEDVQRMLRHKKIETTANLYVHQNADDIREDAENVAKRMGFG